MARQLKKPDKNGKRKWVGELPDPNRPGKTVRVGTYASEQDAKDAEFEAEKARREGRVAVNKTTMTVADLFELFVAHQKRRWEGKAIEYRTYENYEFALRRVLPVLGTIRLRDLKKAHIQEMMYFLAKKYPAGTTPRSTKTSVKTALEYAADDEQAWISPAEVILMFRKLDRLKRKPHRRHATEADLRLFLSEIRQRYPRYELPIIIALTTGMRLGEVCALQWQHCNLAERHFTVAAGLCRRDGLKGTKTGEIRQGVAITDSVHASITQLWLQSGSPTSGLLFPGSRGGKTIYAGLRRRVDEIMKQLGLTVWDEVRGKEVNKFTFHSFRRFYLSEFKEHAGLDAASESVGHASLEQTRDYCRVAVEDPKRRLVADRIGSMFEPRLALPAPTDTTNDTTKDL
jgi:integrase